MTALVNAHHSFHLSLGFGFGFGLELELGLGFRFGFGFGLGLGRSRVVEAQGFFTKRRGSVRVSILHSSK